MDMMVSIPSPRVRWQTETPSQEESRPSPAACTSVSPSPTGIRGKETPMEEESIIHPEVDSPGYQLEGVVTVMTQAEDLAWDSDVDSVSIMDTPDYKRGKHDYQA